MTEEQRSYLLEGQYAGNCHGMLLCFLHYTKILRFSWHCFIGPFLGNPRWFIVHIGSYFFAAITLHHYYLHIRMGSSSGTFFTTAGDSPVRIGRCDHSFGGWSIGSLIAQRIMCRNWLEDLVSKIETLGGKEVIRVHDLFISATLSLPKLYYPLCG